MVENISDTECILTFNFIYGKSLNPGIYFETKSFTLIFPSYTSFCSAKFVAYIFVFEARSYIVFVVALMGSANGVEPSYFFA